MVSRIKNLVSVTLMCLAAIYTASYLLWRGLLLTPLYDTFWQLQLSEVFGAWFYLPLFPLLLLVLMARNGRAAILLAIPFAFFLWEYGAQFLPNWQHGFSTQTVWAQAEDDRDLQVLTWNTLNSSTVQDDFAAFLRDEQPDVVALQEVGRGMHRVLGEEYTDLYPYRYEQYYGRLVTMSRYPIKPILEDSVLLYGCRCQPLALTWRGRTVTLINIHIIRPDVNFSVQSRLPRITSFDQSNQEIYYTALFKLLDEIDGPIILQGDLNTAERQRSFRHLTRTFTDSFAEAGWGFGFTYPHWDRRGPDWLVPLVQIDHILHTNELVAISARTEQLKRSDHLAVMATLRWRE